jgi:WD40 repeat protein
LWDLATGKVVWTVEYNDYQSCPDQILVDPAGQRVFLTGSNWSFTVLDMASGHCVRTFSQEKSGMSTIDTIAAISPDGKWLLSLSGLDDTLKLWDVETGVCLRVLQAKAEGYEGCRVVTFGPDSRWALSASSGSSGRGLLRIWDVGEGRCLRRLENSIGYPYSACVTADGRRAITAGSRTGTGPTCATVWDVTSGECLHTLDGEGLAQLSPDGRTAFSVARGAIHLWDVQGGKHLRALSYDSGDPYCGCITPDGRYLLSGGSDGAIRVWELDWDYEFPGWSDWDEEARPHLLNFLTLHTPYAATTPKDRDPTPEEATLALTRRGRPTWSEVEFQGLLRTLQRVGYGWLRSEGVKHELEKMVADWQGPPPLPWEK